MPLISVVIPTHNRPDMLAEALASVRAQTFADYEIIVVSNGEDREMRRRSLAAAGGGDVRWFELQEGNVSAARNFGVAQAVGEWIAFLDDDDIWLPHKLEWQFAEAMRTGADMIVCDYVEFYPDGREEVRRPRVPAGWTYTMATSQMWFWWTQPSSVVLRRTVFDRVGGFDIRLRCAEDMDLWRRISWRHAIHQMDAVLTSYRSGHSSAMRNRMKVYIYELRHFIKMRTDTPQDLRAALPTMAEFILPRLAKALLPKLLRQPFHPDRLRRRWKTIKSWMT